MRTNVLKFLFAILLICIFSSVKAETVALSDDPNFIKASLLTASPGEIAYQYLGHAAIRLECPTHNLDRVFSFINDSYDDYFKLVLEGSYGRLIEIDYDAYLNDFREEGREVIAYPLNLDLNQKARLWEVMDSLKLIPSKPFDRNSHCFSILAEALDITVMPSQINWDEPDRQQPTYGENGKFVTKGKSPWNYIIMMLPLGELADSKGTGRGYVYPIGFDLTYNQFEIISPDGIRKPLISGEKHVMLEQTKPSRPVHPTPIETGIILIAIVATISIFQILGKWSLAGKVLDVFLWIIVIGGGLFVKALTGHFGGSWNWPFIVVDPLAWIPVLIFRKKKEVMRWIWLFYALVLVLFAAFIWAIAPSTDVFWRLLAIALAIRCVFHASTTPRP